MQDAQIFRFGSQYRGERQEEHLVPSNHGLSTGQFTQIFRLKSKTIPAGQFTHCNLAESKYLGR